MNEEKKYNGEVKIKNEEGKNLFETYEVNGRKYTDNLPKNSFISIQKKQYIEYEQQKEEIERLNNIINKAIDYIKTVGVRPREIDSFVLLNILKGEDK